MSERWPGFGLKIESRRTILPQRTILKTHNFLKKYIERILKQFLKLLPHNTKVKLNKWRDLLCFCWEASIL